MIVKFARFTIITVIDAFKAFSIKPFLWDFVWCAWT